MTILQRTLTLLVISGSLYACATGAPKQAVTPAPAPLSCDGFGPQAPRDLGQHQGTNSHIFSLAPPPTKMNLCNIHFHSSAEHKAEEFSIAAQQDGHGHGGGYQCKISKSLSASELLAPAGDICHGLKPGDTIEVHWVYSSCDVQPGQGLGACTAPNCTNPELRVESQVFTLVNDTAAANFSDFDYAGGKVNGYCQPKSLPGSTGAPIQYTGSTTGPSYSEQSCSPLQVTWSVHPNCAKLDINSLGRWCQGNAFTEDHAHGVRQLVTKRDLLSNMD